MISGIPTTHVSPAFKADQQQPATSASGKTLPADGNLPVAAAPQESVQVELSQSAIDSASSDGHYNVRAMTPRQMAALSLSLYQSGEVSLKEHMLLSFQPELSPQATRIYSEQSGAADTPKDFIAHWETQLRFAEKQGDKESAKNATQILSILQRMGSQGSST